MVRYAWVQAKWPRKWLIVPWICTRQLLIAGWPAWISGVFMVRRRSSFELIPPKNYSNLSHAPWPIHLLPLRSFTMPAAPRLPVDQWHAWAYSVRTIICIPSPAIWNWWMIVWNAVALLLHSPNRRKVEKNRTPHQLHQHLQTRTVHPILNSPRWKWPVLMFLWRHWYSRWNQKRKQINSKLTWHLFAKILLVLMKINQS